MDLIGKAIKQTQRECNITQEELGKLIGVQKAQISRLENNAGAGDVTVGTLLRVFTALKAKVKFQVELSNMNFSVGRQKGFCQEQNFYCPKRNKRFRKTTEDLAGGSVYFPRVLPKSPVQLQHPVNIFLC